MYINNLFRCFLYISKKESDEKIKDDYISGSFSVFFNSDVPKNADSMEYFWILWNVRWYLFRQKYGLSTLWTILHSTRSKNIPWYSARGIRFLGAFFSSSASINPNLLSIFICTASICTPYHIIETLIWWRKPKNFLLNI